MSMGVSRRGGAPARPPLLQRDAVSNLTCHAREVRPSWLPNRSILLGAGLISVIAIGVIGYLSFGYGVAEAIATTLLTLTTVGVATSRDLPPGPLLFTAGLAVLGVSLFAAVVGVAGAAIVEGRLGVLSRSRRMERRISRLQDHFIVCAYGRVGSAAAHELAAEGIPCVVVDIKHELEADMQRDGLPYLIANPSSEQVLREAGIERARGLICAVDSDAENVYITLMARSLRADLLIVARAAQEQSADRLYRAGATRVVSPYVSSGRRMAQLAVRPNVVEFFDIGRTGQQDIRLEELAIPEGSPMAGRTVQEVVGDAIALLVRRANGELFANPGGRMSLLGGDVLVLYGDARTLRHLDAMKQTPGH
jgi:voltage-gated potassium channel